MFDGNPKKKLVSVTKEGDGILKFIEHTKIMLNIDDDGGAVPVEEDLGEEGLES